MSVQPHNEDQIDKTMIVVVTFDSLVHNRSQLYPGMEIRSRSPGPSDVVKIMQTLR